MVMYSVANNVYCCAGISYYIIGCIETVKSNSDASTAVLFRTTRLHYTGRERPASQIHLSGGGYRCRAKMSVIIGGISHGGVRSHPPSRVSVSPGGHIARRHLVPGWSWLMLTTSYIYCSITSVSTTTLAAVSNPRAVITPPPQHPPPPPQQCDTVCTAHLRTTSLSFLCECW